MRDSGDKCLNVEKWLESSAGVEAELYAAALGTSEAMGVHSMMRDLGFEVSEASVEH